MHREAVWYFDVISPFAYLHLQRFGELPANLAIEYKPVLHFARPPPRDSFRRHSLCWQTNRIPDCAAEQQAENSLLNCQLNFHFKARS